MCDAAAVTIKFCLVLIYSCTSRHLTKMDFREQELGQKRRKHSDYFLPTSPLIPAIRRTYSEPYSNSIYQNKYPVQEDHYNYRDSLQTFIEGTDHFSVYFQGV